MAAEGLAAAVLTASEGTIYGRFGFGIAAGFLLAQGLLFPGTRTRVESLALRGREAAVLVLGAAGTGSGAWTAAGDIFTQRVSAMGAAVGAAPSRMGARAFHAAPASWKRRAGSRSIARSRCASPTARRRRRPGCAAWA